jgi:hypothetical protein
MLDLHGSNITESIYFFLIKQPVLVVSLLIMCFSDHVLVLVKLNHVLVVLVNIEVFLLG